MEDLFGVVLFRSKSLEPSIAGSVESVDGAGAGSSPAPGGPVPDEFPGDQIGMVSAEGASIFTPSDS